MEIPKREGVPTATVFPCDSDRGLAPTPLLSRKLQATTTSTSQKRHDGTSRFVLKRIGLRLVHSRNASPRRQEPCGCQYNPRDEFRKNRGIVEGLALDRFTGADGLMLLLSMIAGRELPVQELIELAKRVQIPGYEAAYELFHDAVSEGVIAPAIATGFYLQCEICDAVRWAK